MAELPFESSNYHRPEKLDVVIILMDGRPGNELRCHFVGVKIQGVFESCAEILTTSHWLHVELGKNI
jgi:hypothetical protein